MRRVAANDPVLLSLGLTDLHDLRARFAPARWLHPSHDTSDGSRKLRFGEEQVISSNIEKAFLNLVTILGQPEVIKATFKRRNIMSSKLMIVLTTVGVVGCSFASGALADSYHGTDEASNYDPANVSQEVAGFGYAAVGQGDDWSYASEPRYHGGPKSSW
ncbi:MAG TPA: hypothetical protein VH249_06170 [Xanthobacteraceae bacterium]|nr:hypothetical protein [Xanthobacteraceae bacterium]